VNGDVFIPKAGIFAEPQAKVVSRLIIGDISKGLSSSARFDGRGFCFMETGGQEAGFLNADFYNKKGSTVSLEPSSSEFYNKKKNSNEQD
jgi:sulfide:quinone oxidoreductase